MINSVVSRIFPIGSMRREIFSKIYRAVKPRSDRELILSSFTTGCQPYDKNKKTVILVTHQSSATGAPLLGLNIGKCLKARYNLIHYVMDRSNIHDAFLEDCFVLVDGLADKGLETL
ncbi:hypothetical protein [Francisella philomiragia]|uniref:hypothetical protein n=1 Tax=Francisella philomiragia TaxID=28110 RepID=UPI001907B53C|nr:hypothetical protein [Francisella philomiragia]MBK2105435.1 hypothetical protein [Francisella philomiragia]